MEPWVRPSLEVMERPMEPFTRTLAVRFMNQQDSHSVKRQGCQCSTFSSGVWHAKHYHKPDICLRT